MSYDILLLNIARNASRRAIHFQECIGQHLIASYVSKYDYKAKVYSGDVLDCKSILEKEIKLHAVKIVGFYVGADTVVMVGNIIKWLKKTMDVVAIVGGPEAYALDEIFLKNTKCDYIVIGEGEIPILNLLQYEVDHFGDRKLIKSLKFIDENDTYIETPLEDVIQNLDDIPFPNKENSLNKHFRLGESIGILTGRGCPYHCSFCFEGAASKTVRLRSMQNVFAEIEQVRQSNPSLKCVNVYDDTFTLNKERVTTFCKYMKENKLLWTCEGHVAKLYQNPDMIFEMVDSGLVAMQIGIESGSADVLKAYQKNTTPEMILEVVRQCKKAKLLTLEGNYIIGGAFESQKTLLESMEHAKKLIAAGRGMIEISTVFFSPYYGTPMTKNPDKFGVRVEMERNNHIVTTMRDAVVSTETLSAEEIVKAKETFDELLTQTYYKEARNCNKSEINYSLLHKDKKMQVYQKWFTAWNNCSYIKEFMRHEKEQECTLEKYPIRTIEGYRIEELAFCAQGICLEGLYKDAILYADGSKIISEIVSIMEKTEVEVLEIYKNLNDRCLVYFSEF